MWDLGPMNGDPRSKLKMDFETCFLQTGTIPFNKQPDIPTKPNTLKNGAADGHGMGRAFPTKYPANTKTSSILKSYLLANPNTPHPKKEKGILSVQTPNQ